MTGKDKRSDQTVVTSDTIPARYREFLTTIKTRIHTARIKAALSVNRELIQLYWDLGRLIVERQENEGWGNSVIERLARDLQSAFPGEKGFSSRNIWRMRSFYLAYSREIQDLPQAVAELNHPDLPQSVAEIPWGHNALLIQRLKNPPQRLWYAKKAVEHGWSRSILEMQISSNLYERQGKAITNFDQILPPVESDLATSVFKDPYIFDFLTISEDTYERAVEQELVKHIEKFLLELGTGFSFVGRQVPLQVGTDDFYIDLLFYHLRLRCYVVIELKASPFKPEFAGKLNFYLSAVDDLLRHSDDKPTIGLLLCKSKDSVIAEYALRDINKPMGVADWQEQLTRSLPTELRTSLPTIEELETELTKTSESTIATSKNSAKKF